MFVQSKVIQIKIAQSTQSKDPSTKLYQFILKTKIVDSTKYLVIYYQINLLIRITKQTYED